jgi:hypothetical protein
LVPQQLILQDSGQAPGEVQGFHALQILNLLGFLGIT